MWHKFESLHALLRVPIKVVALTLVVLFVAFPKPALLVRDVQRLRNPNVLIDPSAPELLPFVALTTSRITPNMGPRDVLKVAEKAVVELMPYDWDWNTWGVADYIPTVAEAVAAGREDCDGRAVLSASLLRRLGFHAELVSDFKHVWVKTDHGQTMHPTGPVVVAATEEGLQWNWSRINAVLDALGYGVAVFPWGRELIVVAALWVLALHPRVNRAHAALALLLMVEGWLMLRLAGNDPRFPQRWGQWTGLVQVALALSFLNWKTRHCRRAARAGAAASILE